MRKRLIALNMALLMLFLLLPLNCFAGQSSDAVQYSAAPESRCGNNLYWTISELGELTIYRADSNLSYGKGGCLDVWSRGSLSFWSNGNLFAWSDGTLCCWTGASLSKYSMLGTSYWSQGRLFYNVKDIPLYWSDCTLSRWTDDQMYCWIYNELYHFTGEWCDMWRDDSSFHWTEDTLSNCSDGSLFYWFNGGLYSWTDPTLLMMLYNHTEPWTSDALGVWSDGSLLQWDLGELFYFRNGALYQLPWGVLEELVDGACITPDSFTQAQIQFWTAGTLDQWSRDELSYWSDDSVYMWSNGSLYYGEEYWTQETMSCWFWSGDTLCMWSGGQLSTYVDAGTYFWSCGKLFLNSPEEQATWPQQLDINSYYLWSDDHFVYSHYGKHYEDGEMFDYAKGTAPWAGMQISSLKIEDGVQSIGAFAFSGCSELTDLTIPESVAEIDRYAFKNCTGLTDVTVCGMSTDIDAAAFDGCYEPMMHCYRNSITDHFADEQGWMVTYLDNTAIGSDNTVSVVGVQENAVPPNTHLVVEPAEQATLGTLLLSQFENGEFYPLDISLKKDNEEIQPDGPVTVSIAVPEGWDPEICFVYRVEEDGTLTDMNAVVQDGKLVFTTEHFSRYVVVKPHIHQFTTQVVSATCTEVGYTSYECECGYHEQGDPTAPLGHDWGVGTVTIESTCTQEGAEYFVCARCNQNKTEVTQALGHTPVTDAAVAPTCTATGLTEGSHCSVCNAILTEQTVIDATGHTPVTDAAVAPTCTGTGLTEGSHCSVCNAVLTVQETVKALGHAPVTDAAVAPNCIATGLTEGTHCSVCNEVLTAQMAIPATGHAPATDAAVAPNCTGTGLTEGSHCSVCNAVLTAQSEVAALGHAWDNGKMTVVPSAEAEGEMTYTCTRCKEKKIETLAKLTDSFTDVKKGEYYANAVNWAVFKNITKGVSDTRFAPDATCTRGQIVTFLWRAAGEPTPSSANNPFTDVKESEFYYDAVLWAVGGDITAGTSATTFSPNAGCTRGQVATFLWRYEGKPAAASSNPFKDVKNGEYYYDAVLWAVDNGITNGTSATTFAPNATCTRGQIVTFLFRDINK